MALRDLEDTAPLRRVIMVDGEGRAAPAGGEADNTGGVFNPDSMAQTLTWGTNGVTTVVATNGVNTWTRTFTYTNGNLTGVSIWVKT